MIDHEQDEEDAVNGAVAVEQRSNVLSQIKKRRVELQRERSLDKEVPGYNGLLLARLRPVPWDDLKKIQVRLEKIKGNPRVELIGHTDTIIRATEMLLVRDAGEITPLHEVEGSEDEAPIGWDLRLAATLDLGDIDTARKILWRVFNNDYAVTLFHNELMEWQRDSDQEVDDDLLGEAVGTS